MTTVLHDAWTTIVPERDGRHGPLPPILLVKTLVTGLVDAFSYLVLGHVFVANMTGNVVFAGFGIAGATGFSFAAAAFALAAFAVGAVVCGRIVSGGTPDRGRVLRTALAVQTVFIAAAFATAEAASDATAAGVRYALIILLGVGMGIQNASARYLAVPDMTTTVLTQTVTGIASDSRLAGGPGTKSGRRLLSAVVMLLGGFAGASLVIHHHQALPLLIGAVLLAGATIVAFAVSRSGGPWTEPVTAGPTAATTPKPPEHPDTPAGAKST